MNTPITCDQRGCGQGKTTGAIYKRIDSNQHKQIPTLIAVPSILLQQQYSVAYPQAAVINSEIYNEYHAVLDSCSKAIEHHMRMGAPVIIITHSAFVQLCQYSGFKGRYDLIIDEALDQEIIDYFSIKQTQAGTAWAPDFKFDQLLKFTNQYDQHSIQLDKTDTTWYQLTATRVHTSILSTSPIFQAMADQNRTVSVTATGWHTLTQQTTGKIDIVIELDPGVLVGWHSVFIAAAAFKFTQMYAWMQHHNIEVNFVKPFKKHQVNIQMYTDKRLGQMYAKISGLTGRKYSNKMRKQYPQFASVWQQHVRVNALGEILSIRNRNAKLSILGEWLLNHNPHGLNLSQLQKSLYTTVNLESSLNMTPIKDSYIRSQWLSAMDKTQSDSLIAHFSHAYLFYQVVMRTRLRDLDQSQQLPVRVFCPDLAIATRLLNDYFDTTAGVLAFNEDLDLIQLLNITPKKPGPKTRLTPEQVKENRRLLNQKKYLERKEKKKQNK